jgi:hypothetical protein
MTTLDLSAFQFAKDPLVDREAKRVIELAYHTGAHVIPSEIVDQALYEAIENGLMARIEAMTGRPLLHDVGIIGERMHRLYGISYAAYEAYFGEKPPAAVWDAPSCCGMSIAQHSESAPAACGMMPA